MAPSRPTVIRPKVVETPKKKPPPRPPPPKSGSIASRGSSRSNSGFVSDSTATDLDAVVGSTPKPAWTETNGSLSGLFARRTGFAKGQLSLFGSMGKGIKNTPTTKKGPAPKQPQIRNSFRNKGAAPAPPVPPHRNNRTGALDGCPPLISFDTPPASPTCSVASGSSGASSGASWQSTGTGGVGPVSLLDLAVPLLQELPWSSHAGLPHSRTTHWGRAPSEQEGGAGDSVGDDAWNFPRNNSLPSLPVALQQDATPLDPWSFPDTHRAADSEAEVSPTENRSPPPPLHPPPEPPPEDVSSSPQLSGAAIAKCDYQASAPGELSFRARDLIALLSEERPGMFRGRCGSEEGLVPKHCLDVLSFPRPSGTSAADQGKAVAATCRALYDFEAESAQELSLKQGDLVHYLAAINEDWALGELGGKRGRFPTAFVEPPQQPQQPMGCPAVALYSFAAEQDGDLGFYEGDTVTVLSRINKDWLYGEHGGGKGQFPASFVQPISKQTTAKGASVDIYRATFPFEAQHSDELTLHLGDRVQVTRKVNGDWWQGRLLGSSAASSTEGIFPAAFVERLS